MKKPPLLDKPYPRHRPVLAEEAALWHEALEGKKESASKPKSKERTAALPAKEAMKKPMKKKLPPPTPHPLDGATLARIKRGATRIEARLDLHGLTREQAYTALLAFIEKQQLRGLRTVLVITGKGKGEEGTLRALLPRWLNESPLREHIIAYDSAGTRHGGGGAWYLRIRKPMI